VVSARYKDLIAGADTLKPLRQGELDRLCGLYSAINAVRLVIFPRPLSHAEERKLFVVGLKRLTQHWNLNHAVSTGMSNPAMADVAATLAKKASQLTGLNIVTVRAAKSLTREERDAWLDEQLAIGNPVLAEFKAIDHFSVCCGLTAKRVAVFDTSGRLSTVRRRTGKLIAFTKVLE
jgi:hypothetical protein